MQKQCIYVKPKLATSQQLSLQRNVDLLLTLSLFLSFSILFL